MGERAIVRCGLRSLKEGTHHGIISPEVKYLMENDPMVHRMMRQSDGHDTFYGDDEEDGDSGDAEVGKLESKVEPQQKKMKLTSRRVRSFESKPWYSNQKVRAQAGVFFGLEEGGERKVYRVSYCQADDDKEQYSAFCEKFVVLQTAPIAPAQGIVPFFVTRIVRPVSPIILYCVRLWASLALGVTIPAA